MANSPLVTYTKLSPNHYGKRNHVIDTITLHCVVGHISLQSLGSVFAPSSRKASSNYGVDDQGRVGMYVEEGNASWCTSSSSNDHRAVTIEIASDNKAPYKITDSAMSGVIKLCVDICRRNGIKKLLWKGDKSLIGKIDQQNMTVHRWFKNKDCPGAYIYDRLGDIAMSVNRELGSTSTTSKPENVSPAKKEYRVKITSSTVNYRKGPGTNYPVSGIVHKNEVYTIIEESLGAGSSKWGKLKSGAGWIGLDHTSIV